MPRTNIVKAKAGPKTNEITTAPLYQYDYGQVLVIEGIELPAAYQVHFSNEPYGSSTTSIGGEDGVEIPDVYLTSGADVYAWLYLHEGEDDGETVLKIRIPVQPRAEITHETPTPVQQSAIDELIIALNMAVDAAEDAEDVALAAQQAAEEAAERAAHYDPDGKLDKPEEEGTQGQVLTSDGEGGQAWQDPEGGAEIDDTSTALNKVWSAHKMNDLTIEEKLLRNELPGTTVTVTFDQNGNPDIITHSVNNTAVRTDTFVWGEGTVTETRTLANGKYITITTDLETLAQTISAVQEVA